MQRVSPSGLRHDLIGGDRSEAGFTLVEVMVVVLILGILLSIGVPTFLGARDRAHDAAARSSLNTSLETAMVIARSDPGADFATADAAALNQAEPSLTFLTNAQPSSGPDEVSVDATSVESWTATVRSRSGRCFGAEVTADGATTFESASCAANLAADVNAPINVAPTSAVSLSSDWRDPGYEAGNLNDGSLITFAHTDWQRGQSAAFDLGRSMTITEIQMWNRPDCCRNRMQNMWIGVSDSDISTDLATAQRSDATMFYVPGIVGSPTVLPIDTSGRHVRFFATGSVLHLAEIEIYALP